MKLLGATAVLFALLLGGAPPAWAGVPPPGDCIQTPTLQNCTHPIIPDR
jgi:hypothetical protein